MKVQSKNLTKEERIRTLDALYTAATHVRGRTEVKAFLRDLLTESERIMMGRRILIARHLIAQRSFEKISEDLHVSPKTISKVQHWLEDQFPGYEKALEGLEKEFVRRRTKTASSRKRPNDPNFDSYLYATSALYRLKKKYPIHFLLFPMPKRK